MKLQRILEHVYCRPWAITPSAFSNIKRLLDSKLAGDSIEDFLSGGDDEPGFTVVGSTAIVPIEGVILPKCSGIEAYCGAFSLEDFKSNLKALAANDLVKNVILSFDSPGGCVGGVVEAADAINQLALTKTIYSFVGAGCMAASAAYWLASQSKAIFASKSAETGSIGVFCAVLDETGAYEQAGYAVEMFKAGEQKAMGYPGTSLSDKDRTYLQDSVNKSYQEFTTAVKTKRPAVQDSSMQGLVYEADDAIKLGLVDAQLSDLDSLVDYLNQ